MLKLFIYLIPLSWLEYLVIHVDIELDRRVMRDACRRVAKRKPEPPTRLMTAEDIDAEVRRRLAPIEDEDDIFQHPDYIDLPRPRFVLPPGTFAWGTEPPTISEPPPPAPDIEYVFEERRREETALTRSRNLVPEPAPKCEKCGEEKTMADDDGRTSPYWVCEDCNKVNMVPIGTSHFCEHCGEQKKSLSNGEMFCASCSGEFGTGNDLVVVSDGPEASVHHRTCCASGCRQIAVPGKLYCEGCDPF